LATKKDTIELINYLNQNSKSYLNRLVLLINKDYVIQQRIANSYPFLSRISYDNLKFIINELLNNYYRENQLKSIPLAVNKSKEIITFEEYLDSFDDKCSDMLIRLLERCDRNATLVYGLCFSSIELPPAFIACVLGAIAQNNWCHNDAKEDYQLCKQGKL